MFFVNFEQVISYQISSQRVSFFILSYITKYLFYCIAESWTWGTDEKRFSKYHLCRLATKVVFPTSQNSEKCGGFQHKNTLYLVKYKQRDVAIIGVGFYKDLSIESVLNWYLIKISRNLNRRVSCCFEDIRVSQK